MTRPNDASLYRILPLGSDPLGERGGVDSICKCTKNFPFDLRRGAPKRSPRKVRPAA